MNDEKTVYQLKIQLKYITPSIWRMVQIKSSVLLPDLHKIIQTVMGWLNSHLHDFSKGDKQYGIIDEEFGLGGIIDYSNVRLNEILKKPGDKLEYMYDFGDGWRHEIVLEKILDQDSNQYYPKCTKGKRSCPPEDCGGSFGYEDLLKILENPKHPEYNERKEWVGDYFFPEEFDIKTVNEMLHGEDFGCLDLSDF